MTILALIAPAAFAQTVPALPAAKTPLYEHCIVVLGDSYFHGRDVQLDFGQNGRGAVQNPELIQASAVVRGLGSVVAALNYMSSQGWECISVSTIPSSPASTGYLLRRAK